MSSKTCSCSPSGFTLVELLVVVAIIAVLAAIAVPQYAAYKRNGVDSSMESALANARIAMESYYEKNNYRYDSASLADLEDRGFRETNGLTLVVESTTPTTYKLRACQIGGNSPSYVFESTNGKILGDPGTC